MPNKFDEDDYYDHEDGYDYDDYDDYDSVPVQAKPKPSQVLALRPTSGPHCKFRPQMPDNLQ
jgi:hypothetical protein